MILLIETGFLIGNLKEGWDPQTSSLCLCILLEIPGQLHNLLLGISMDITREFNFLLTKLEFHMRQLLSFSPVIRCNYIIAHLSLLYKL